MNFRTKCLLLLVVTALLWSISGVIIKSINWNPLGIASARSLIAGFTIAFLARNHKIFRKPAPSQLIGAIIMAMVSVAFVSATKLTTAANAILLQYTAPIWVAIAAPFILKERTRGLDWIFIGITLCGMALFFLDSISAEGFWGIVIAICSSVFFAGMAIAVRYNNEDGPPFTIVIYGNIIVFLAGLYFWQPPWPGPKDIALLLLLGVVQYGVSFYLYTLASRGVTSLELVLITTLEPILNPIWVFLAIGERPGNWALAGGAIVLLSVTGWSVLKTLRPTPGLNNPEP
ncbi:EamA family transporter [Deltaproteobacteria bacterium Smac51]|nr:EamA family transporter [Deltaproteobacteria bacterium Smac51]